jgi:GTP-binding protein EngB required for normal cell division
MSDINIKIFNELTALHEWKTNLATSLRSFNDMASSIDMLSSGTLLKIESTAQDIENDRIRLAFVGEFSRGKSELINALFFSERGRLLPSSPGQTTMCPVEISGATDDRPRLELLPIASRSLDVNISKLKRAGSAWWKYPISEDNMKETNESLAHLTETTCVSIEEARKLGLCPPLNRTSKDRERTVCTSCGLGKVLIPRWRHAMLYMKHSALNAGLTILDTPGLNAIGAEPELTFSMLADAEAVVFVLGVDTGVTQSDLTVWEQYISGGTHRSHLVVLNKVDMLWDELKEESQFQKEVDLQVTKTAAMLNIDRSLIIPVSGKSGLLARVKNNTELLEKSGIAELESAISDILIPIKKRVIKDKVRSLVSKVTSEQNKLLNERVNDIKAQSSKMQDLRHRTSDKVPRMIANQRQKVASFKKDMETFKQKKLNFIKAADDLVLTPLDTATFDMVINRSKAEMLSAWTTAGIVDRLSNFFSDAMLHFDAALDGATKVTSIIEKEYQLLQKSYHLPELQAIPYAIMPKRAELINMAAEYERFGMLLEIAVNTQNAVVRKAFLTVSSRTRDFILETRKDAERWINDIMDVMNKQLQRYHDEAENELLTLENISNAVESIDIRLSSLRINMKEAQKNINDFNVRANATTALLNQ